MRYPGNATLTRDIQERILSTFEQTLSAAATGNRREGLLGCDFILRLDPLFEPARDLQQRLGAGEGPVEIADLRTVFEDIQRSAGEAGAEEAPQAVPEAPAAETPAADAPPAAPPTFDGLEDLDINLEVAGDSPAAETPAEAPAPSEAVGAEPPMSGIDDLDDLDVAAGLEDLSAQVSAEAPADAEAPAETPAPSEGVGAEPPISGIDDLDDLDVATSLEDLSAPVSAEPAPAAQTPTAEPVAPEPPAPQPPSAEPAAPEPPTAESPAEPVAPEPPTAESPPAEPVAPEPPAAQPPTAEPAMPEEAAAGPAEAAAEPAIPSLTTASEDGGIPLDTEPAARLDAESEQRISDLLGEGQAAFESGEFQGAIDAWSRIFLIDIDHPEANRRIEQARKLKAEADRQVEEKFHEGLSQLEAGDTAAAAEAFRGVLELQPSHVTARDYLEKLDAGEVPIPVERPPAAELPDADGEAALAEPGELADESLDEELPEPERGQKAVGERMVTVRRSPFRSPIFMITAGLGLVAVVAGGWYLATNWSQLFPNSSPEVADSAPARPDPVTRAQSLHADGKTPMAIALLRRLPPDHPRYDEAQTLIAQWEVQDPAPAEQAAGPPPEELRRRESLLVRARQASQGREFLLTSELLSEAAAIVPLKGEEVQLLAQADEQLQSLQNLISLFRQGDWDFAVRDLWLLRESEPDNRDVTRLLVDSYYNLGVRDLQRNDAVAAANQFREALNLVPADPELRRLFAFAELYQARPQDLQYRIYVKYLPFR